MWVVGGTEDMQMDAHMLVKVMSETAGGVRSTEKRCCTGDPCTPPAVVALTRNLYSPSASPVYCLRPSHHPELSAQPLRVWLLQIHGLSSPVVSDVMVKCHCLMSP